MGNTQQQGEQGFCVARNIALMSGLPVETGGVTINRLCGSSLQAINQGAHAIMSGFEKNPVRSEFTPLEVPGLNYVISQF